MTDPTLPEQPPQPPPQVIYVQAPPPRKTNTYAVVSLIFGILSALGGWCCFGAPGFIALIAGYIGYRDTKDGKEAGNGMAVAGLVLGGLTAAFWIVMGIAGIGSSIEDAFNR